LARRQNNFTGIHEVPDGPLNVNFFKVP